MKKNDIEAAEQSIPAGHTRNEALRELNDEIEQAHEELIDQTGAIELDPNKLNVKNVDNEIAVHWNPERGDLPFSHPQPGFKYAWVTHEDPHGHEARTSIRAMHHAMKRVGWHPVEGDMPEGKEFRSKDCCAGTTGRGLGDVQLYRIREEEWAKVEQANERKRLRNEGIEDAFAQAADSTGVTRSIGRDMLSRVYGPDRMRPVAYSAAFSQEQIRNGTGPLPPGFEIRGRR